MITIVPSILEPTAERFRQRYGLVAQFAAIGQVDVLNNTFLPYESFHDPDFINEMKPAIPLEVHLMVHNPIAEVPRWDYPWVKKIIFHHEAAENVRETIDAIKQLGKQPGVALNPETAASAVRPFLDSLDTVLVMTVHPGRNGSPFVPETLQTIRAVRKFSSTINIEADGGIRPDTGLLARAEGANVFVVGSFLDNEHFKEKFDQLSTTLNG